MRLRVCLLFLFIISGLSLPNSVLAQPSSASLAIGAYWEKIESFLVQLDAVDVDDDAMYKGWLASTANQLTEIEAVVLPNGRSIPINHAPLVSVLEADPPPDPAQIRGLLQTWLDTQNDLLHTEDAEIDSLRDILADERFIYVEEPPIPVWRQWINDRLADILQFFARGGSLLVNNTTGTILSAVSVVVLVGVFAYILNGLVGNFTPQATLHDELGEELPLNAEMALERAQSLSMGGDYRTAVRYLYLSSLLMLEERGLLRYNRSLTNREYLKAVAHRPELVQWLKPVIDVFDRVWYGYQPLSKEEYTQYQEWVEGLKKTDA